MVSLYAELYVCAMTGEVGAVQHNGNCGYWAGVGEINNCQAAIDKGDVPVSDLLVVCGVMQSGVPVSDLSPVIC